MTEGRLGKSLAPSLHDVGECGNVQQGAETKPLAAGAALAGGPYRDRLWEQAGQKGLCAVGLKVKTLQPVNLRGQPLGEPIRPTSPQGFLIKLEPSAPADCVLSE